MRVAAVRWTVLVICIGVLLLKFGFIRRQAMRSGGARVEPSLARYRLRGFTLPEQALDGFHHSPRFAVSGAGAESSRQASLWRVCLGVGAGRTKIGMGGRRIRRMGRCASFGRWAALAGGSRRSGSERGQRISDIRLAGTWVGNGIPSALEHNGVNVDIGT